MENDKTKNNEVPVDDEISAEELEQVNGGITLNFTKIEYDYKEKVNVAFLKNTVR